MPESEAKRKQRAPAAGAAPGAAADAEAGAGARLMIRVAFGAHDAIGPGKARLVELRYFGGLTNSEVAELLGVSEATVERDWTFAKAWLHRRMTNPKWSDDGAAPPAQASDNTLSDNGLRQ